MADQPTNPAAQPAQAPAQPTISTEDQQLLGWAKNMRGMMYQKPEEADAEFKRVMAQMHPQKAAATAPARVDADDPVSALAAQVDAIARRDAEREEALAVERATRLVDETLAGKSDVFKRGTPAFDEKAWHFARQNMLAEGAHNPQADFNARASELAQMFIDRKVAEATKERDTRAAQQANMTTLPPGQGAPQVTTPRTAKVDDWDTGKREEQYRQLFDKAGRGSAGLRAIFGRDFGPR